MRQTLLQVRSTAWVTAALVAAGCGGSETADAAGGSGDAPVLFVEGLPSERSPLGTWCVTRSGRTLAASPVTDGTAAGPGHVLALGGEHWLWHPNFGASVAARLDSCRLDSSQALPTLQPRWSNAGAFYLDFTVDGPLGFGRPGEALVTLEEARVIDVGWSPHHARAWYTRRGESPETGLPLELFVLDLDAELDVAPAAVAVARDVIQQKWTSNGDWLLYVTAVAGGIELHAWSYVERTSRLLSRYSGYDSIELAPSADSRFVLVSLPMGRGDGTERPPQYLVVSIEDGLERSLVTLPDNQTMRWLWPESWLEYTPRAAGATLFDVSDLENIVTTSLGAPLAALSPQPGVAVRADAEGRPRLVTGLPGSVAIRRDLPVDEWGSFSADGRYWASINFPVDENGRVESHGGLLSVTDTSAADASTVVTSLDGRGPNLDGIHWLDARSFVLVLFGSGATTSVALVELVEGSWRVSQIDLPGFPASARSFAVGSDPCDSNPIRRSVRTPGCASPWR